MASILLTAVSLSASAAAGPASRPAVRVSLTLKDGGRVRGTLLKLTDTHVDVRAAAGTRRVRLADARPNSVYMLRRQVLDLTDPKVHVRLGAFCLRHGLKREADREFNEALRLDKSLAGEIERIRAEAKSASVGAAGPPAPPPRRRRPKVDDKDVRKYVAATPRQIERALKRAADWGERTKRFAPALHLVESPHFLIYSAWSVGNDRPLRDVCENMYATLCRQFDIPRGRNIWAGKCAVYVFRQKDHYRKFCSDVYKSGDPDAAGYCGWYGGGFVFIVMGPARSTRQFYELLVHEGTHGFIARYRSNRGIPDWVNEGLAEYMAATLVPKAYAARKHVNATRQAVREGKAVEHVFDDVGLNHFDYGIAQSWVRFLIARDKKAFAKFIDLMKDGKTDEQAMKKAFRLTRQQFLVEWARASARAVDGGR